MKIALVTPYYFPVLGGYTLITYGLSKAYHEKGHEVIILTPKCDPLHKNENIITFDMSSLSRKDKSQIQKGLNFWERLFGFKEMTSIQRDMVLEIERIKPDIVHTFGAIQFAFIGTMSSARNYHWVHTFITQPPKKLSSVKRIVAKKIFSRANLITVTAANQVKDIKEKIGLDVNKAIKVGVDTTFFTPPAQLQESPIIGTVSNFVWKEKVEGLLLLIRSFKGVLNAHPDTELEIVGEGEFRNLVEKTIKAHGLEKKVKLLGRMERKELSKFYRSISVYTHISYQDTLPLTVLEAMTSGIPIVASDIGDMPNVVTKDIGIVTNFKEETISKAISKLLSSYDLRLKLGKNARLKAEKEFSWPHVADKYLTAYEDILR
ncbi:MAG: glycosyltransferase family 4 protein [Thermoplasmata archaeon]|nr:MAG: glycosyltransferase family 4 protein [Thermoplasmata archaeon]